MVQLPLPYVPCRKCTYDWLGDVPLYASLVVVVPVNFVLLGMYGAACLMQNHFSEYMPTNATLIIHVWDDC